MSDRPSFYLCGAFSFVSLSDFSEGSPPELASINYREWLKGGFGLRGVSFLGGGKMSYGLCYLTSKIFAPNVHSSGILGGGNVLRDGIPWAMHVASFSPASGPKKYHFSLSSSIIGTPQASWFKRLFRVWIQIQSSFVVISAAMRYVLLYLRRKPVSQAAFLHNAH